MRQIIFMRHGARHKAATVGPDDVVGSLTKEGAAQARFAGAWVAAHALSPTHVLHTKTVRTRQTAELAAQALPAPPRWLKQRTISSKAAATKTTPGWADFLGGLVESLPVDSVLLLVGHDTTLDFLARAAGARRAPKRDTHAGVLVLDLVDGELVLSDQHLGFSPDTAP